MEIRINCDAGKKMPVEREDELNEYHFLWENEKKFIMSFTENPTIYWCCCSVYTFSHLIMQISWVADDIVALAGDDDVDGTYHGTLYHFSGGRDERESRRRVLLFAMCTNNPSRITSTGYRRENRWRRQTKTSFAYFIFIHHFSNARVWKEREGCYCCRSQQNLIRFSFLLVDILWEIFWLNLNWFLEFLIPSINRILLNYVFM